MQLLYIIMVIATAVDLFYSKLVLVFCCQL